ncbi:MAG: hypothetical protein AB1529_03730, partial [Candidatus Micrarchaeota archaeon]
TWYLARNASPPYVDLLDNRSIRGFVDAIYLNDSSCADCFDVASLSDYISQSAGLAVVNSTSYDINSSEGQALASKYNITAVPTVLYSPEASYYPSFTGLWVSQNNTVESDGWFVFRAYPLLSGVTYRNITG